MIEPTDWAAEAIRYARIARRWGIAAVSFAVISIGANLWTWFR